jgi:hypothetical protein
MHEGEYEMVKDLQVVQLVMDVPYVTHPSYLNSLLHVCGAHEGDEIILVGPSGSRFQRV